MVDRHGATKPAVERREEREDEAKVRAVLKVSERLDNVRAGGAAPGAAGGRVYPIGPKLPADVVKEATQKAPTGPSPLDGSAGHTICYGFWTHKGCALSPDACFDKNRTVHEWPKVRRLCHAVWMMANSLGGPQYDNLSLINI